MDALRASSMLLLVPAHTVGILAVNGDPSGWGSTIYWLIHVFRLPLFFAMSGFFLALLLARRGLGSTLRNRSLRIAIPLGVGLLTLTPLLIALSQSTGVAVTGGVDLAGPYRLEPGFLWFLWYLLIFDAIAFGAYVLAPEALEKLGGLMRQAIARPFVGISLLAIPTALALWQQPNWMVAPPIRTFVPDPPTLAYYGLFFALGATLCRYRELVSGAQQDAWRWLACALAATLPAGVLFAFHNSPQMGGQTAVHLAALLTYAIATWTTLVALVGLAGRYLARPRPAFRYIADSSYWIYLTHMMPMVLIVAALNGSGLGIPAQFVLITAGSLAVSLAAYPLLARYTPIGWVLNGKRERRPGDRASQRERIRQRKTAEVGSDTPAALIARTRNV